MSHLKERAEKNCLNCQTEMQGRYCHVCGQENIEPKESFWHLVTHFTYDVTHFDGKFFSTLRYLLFKPGFLSKEYLRGRRASYLHPIRMYVFTSALFFLIFFSTRSEDDGVMKVNLSETSNAADIIKRLEKRKKTAQEAIDEFKRDSTPGEIPDIPTWTLLQRIVKADSNLARLRRDTMYKHTLESTTNEYNFLGGTQATKFKSVSSYDSAQAALPEDQRDNFFERRFTKQNLRLKEKYNNDGKAIWKAILNKFNHMFPQMLFVSLPLFALALQLLYVRRKQFFYVNHIIFTIHLYCGTFILILAVMAINGIFKMFHGELPSWLGLIFFLVGSYYWYKSMRNFYEQRRGKTILKYILAWFLSIIIMSLLFTAFFVFSALSI